MDQRLFELTPSTGWRQYALRFVLIVILVFVSFCGGWVAKDAVQAIQGDLHGDVNIRIDPDSGNMTLRGPKPQVAKVERLIRFGAMPLPGETSSQQ